MLIHDMTRLESIDLLTRIAFGRLACSHEGQPYITPIYYAYDADCLYSFTTLGKKIDWMRANPLVCVAVEDLVGPQEWTTVVVSGRYEELPNTPEYEKQRKRAHALLEKRPTWWEPGYVKTVLNEQPRPMEPLYFRIHIDEISGRRAVPEAVSKGTHAMGASARAWVRRVFGRPRHH
jgi:uncharacterized protein